MHFPGCNQYEIPKNCKDPEHYQGTFKHVIFIKESIGAGLELVIIITAAF